MLHAHPRMIRLTQLSQDLHDHAEAAALPDGTDDSAQLAGMIRLVLAQTIALTLSEHAEPRALGDPELGVARTQQCLSELGMEGYRTAYSADAFTSHLLDEAVDRGAITVEQEASYRTGASDPSELIESLRSEVEARRVELPDGAIYYLSREV